MSTTFFPSARCISDHEFAALTYTSGRGGGPFEMRTRRADRAGGRELLAPQVESRMHGCYLGIGSGLQEDDCFILPGDALLAHSLSLRTHVFRPFT